jgi:hypothetical protein
MEDCAKCPFFISKSRDEKRQITITHEAPVDNLGFNILNQVRFNTIRDRKDFFELFCADMYAACPFYKEIERKYEEADRKKN